MATGSVPAPVREASNARTLQDLIESLGGISLARVLAQPPPGAATEADLLENNEHTYSLRELVEGVLVEKPMGFRESLVAAALIRMLGEFVHSRNLGIIAGESGTIRLAPGLVRAPDVAFFAWGRFPGGRVPPEPIPSVAPDLAVEVLSDSNTHAEMERKRGEYFRAGVDVVWLIDPRVETVEVYAKGDVSSRMHDRTQTIEGTHALSGFRLVVADLFNELG